MLLVGVEVTLHRNNGDRMSGLPDPNGGAFDAAGDFDSLIGSTDLPMIGSLDSCGYSTLSATIMADLIADVDKALEIARPGSELRGLRRLRVMAEIDDERSRLPGDVSIGSG